MARAPITALDGPASWRRLAISLAAAVTGNVGMWSIILIMPAVQTEFAITRGGAALPYTATMVGFALGNLVIGRWVDRFGMAWALAVASVLSAVGYLAAAFAPSVAVLAAAQALVGLGAAAFFGPLIADVSLWFRTRRGLAVAIVASGNYIAGAFWPWILTGLLMGQGWRAVCLFLAVAVPVLVLPIAAILRQRLPEALMSAGAQSAPNAPRFNPFTPRTTMILLMLAGVACCVAMSMPQVHIVAYCVDLGYGPAVGAEMLSLMLLGGVVSRLVSGLVADRLGGLRTLLIGSVLQMLALALYLPSDGLASLYLVSLIFGLAQGGIVPAYALIVRETMPAKEAGARVGLVIMATIWGMALGGWMSGWIFDVTGSYTMAFLNGILWNALNVGIVLTFLWRRPTRVLA